MASITPSPSVVTNIITQTVTMGSATASSTVRAAPQGGILEGLNPSVYDSKNPITIFIIQAGIILIFCRLLHYPLSLIRQPKVIAEVIGGILLGPSVLGRIPNFTKSIFPTESIPNLSLVANLGLVLFLFLVGLEVDMRLFRSNWRIAALVAGGGLVIPFGLGCAISVGLYNSFKDEPGTVEINFGVFMLFIAVAMAITAFPVLCRILTELKLLSTPVGVIVLSAGVTNDVVGWVLLALCVALVNAGSGLTALWVLLVAVGYVIFLFVAVRPAFMWLLRRTGSIEDGPSQGIVGLTLLMALASAWFTGIIGVHPIFGAFLIGLICPHDGGFAIKVTEKVEDIVSVIFLPLYFAYSGLNTNLGLLNNGLTWAYVIGVIAVAFFSKIIGSTLMAKLGGLVWRESFTVGALMSCKGLVELIVLNIGLQAKILSSRTFTIFVVMALVTTFLTTPLTMWLYPPWYQRKLEAWKRGEINWDGTRHNDGDHGEPEITVEKLQSKPINKILLYLRLDSLPGLFTFVALLGGDANAANKTHHSRKQNPSGLDDAVPTSNPVISHKRPMEVHGVRMLELTERTSTVMAVSELSDFPFRDLIVSTFRTFAQLYNVAVSASVEVVPGSAYAETLSNKASEVSSDLVFIPWSESSNVQEEIQSLDSTTHDLRFASPAYNAFVQQALSDASHNIAVFFNRGFGGGGGADAQGSRSRVLSRTRSLGGLSIRSAADELIMPVADRSHHIFFPFVGGADDQYALRFVLQLLKNPNITATIVYFQNPDAISSAPSYNETSVNKDGVLEHATSVAASITTSPRQQQSSSNDAAFFASLRDSVPSELSDRVVFTTESSSNPLPSIVQHATIETSSNTRNAGNLIVLGRTVSSYLTVDGEQSSPMGRDGVAAQLDSTYEIRRTLGAVAEKVLQATKGASLVVVKAKKEGGSSL